MRVLSRLSLLAMLAASAACTVKDTPMPSLAGPSELALRVSLQAIPDSILQDGLSQAADPDRGDQRRRPARPRADAADPDRSGSAWSQDFGTLSTKTVVTGDDGRARVTYTAPPRRLAGRSQCTVVTFAVEPVGTDYRGEIARTVDLRLVMPGIIQPPLPPVDCRSRSSPSRPAARRSLTNVVFDASTTDDQRRMACRSLRRACNSALRLGLRRRHDRRAGSSRPISSAMSARSQVQADGHRPARRVGDVRAAGSMSARAAAPTASFTFSPSARGGEPADFLHR